MAKDTTYSELRNLHLTVSFNQKGNSPVDIQPIVIDARADAVTDEGAILNVENQVNIGEIVTQPLTNEEIYKMVFGISPVLAKALEGVLLTGISQDVSTVDVKDVQPIGVADIAVAKPKEVVDEKPIEETTQPIENVPVEPVK